MGAFRGCKSLNMSKYKGDLESSVYFEMKSYQGEVLVKTAEELEEECYGQLTKYLIDEENCYYITKRKKLTDKERQELKQRILQRMRGE